MEVTRLGWLGTRTDRAPELVEFYSTVLGLPLVHSEPSFWVFALPGGRHVEVFGFDYPGRSTFEGPVAGFEVTGLAAAVEELHAAGIEPVG